MHMEEKFQKYIAGGYVPVRELYKTMGKKALPLGELLGEADRRRMQVYLDYGQGFSEEQSFFIDQGYSQKVSCSIPVPEGAVGIWIDPALSPCILKDVRLRWRTGKQQQTTGGSVAKSPVQFTATGLEIEKNCFLFDNLDPKIIIEEIPQGKRRIDISYQISILEESTAKLLMENAKLLKEKLDTKGRMKKKVRRMLHMQR